MPRLMRFGALWSLTCLEQAAAIEPIAVPVVSAYPVAAGRYYSYIVRSRSTKPGEPRVVVNSLTSHSGHTALKLWLAENQIEDYALEVSGSHAQSVLDLQAGRADFAAIDALSWQFLDTTGLEIVDQSEPAWAPPFIAGQSSDVPSELLVTSLNSAFKRFGDSIGIKGAIPISRGAYT